MDVILPPVVVSIAERMATEGIPVRAIARCVQFSSEIVRETLVEAMACGKVIDMPRDDWPVNTERNRVPCSPGIQVDEQAMITGCQRLFKITRLQASLLSVLLRRKECSKEMLHTVVEQCRNSRLNKSDALETTDPKIVDVVVCHLRKKLKPHGLAITTIWGSGYCMSADMRKRGGDMLSEFSKAQELVGDTTDDDAGS